MVPQSEGRPSGDGRSYGGRAYPEDGRQYHADRDLALQDGRVPRPSGGPPGGFGSENRIASPAGSLGGRVRDGSYAQGSEVRNRSRNRGARTTSGQLRICKKCDEPLTGQFVRALGGTFHLDCFTCRDCNEIVASKFFPVDEETGEGGQYPLCETDYFRRLDLICYQCNGALRGSYITALDRKYHINHFTCSACPTVFGAQDSYYEHDGQVYCHFHYSTQFAQRCNGCHTAILKQFVEIYRNGQNQHWHPECYMIHKFWNVRLASSTDVTEVKRQIEETTDEEGRNAVRDEEEKMEEKVYKIWSVLSTFEESSAACISDMLLHVSNAAYADGVMVAKKFIFHVDMLFHSMDKLDAAMAALSGKGLSYSREAKLLCKKIVAFFALLSKTQETGVRKLGVTQELLALVTGLAHYLKLLIRICLQGALKVEREQKSSEGLNHFLEDLSDMEAIKNDERSLEALTGTPGLAEETSDRCVSCQNPIEDECACYNDKRWHLACLRCASCSRDLGRNLEDAQWNETEHRIFCNTCEDRTPSTAHGFSHVSRLQQYVYLLRAALARLLARLVTSGILPHTSDDPNLNGYNSSDGHRLSQSGPPLTTSDSRSKSYSADTSEPSRASYADTLNDVRRLRSTRMDKHLSSTIRKARTSRIMDGPEGRTVRPGSAGADGSDMRNNGFQITEEGDGENQSRTELMFGHQNSLTLDDIPRIVAAEQAKEQRPNAYKHARQDMFPGPATEPKLFNGHQRNVSSGNPLDLSPNEDLNSQRRDNTKKYFSELSALEYFIVRHVAVIAMQPLLEGHFTMEELLALIETRKPTFWNKMGKAFKNDGKKGGKKKGVFGVPLDVIIDRDGADSTDGIGPGALRIPAIVDDTVRTMRKMDLSVEGVFRKNGNIKRLNDTTAIIDKDGCDAVDFGKDNVVQVAALLKKYLRALPDPLLTFKLYKLFIASSKIADREKRLRVLHLTCCLLPKAHRDCLEILCSFFNWAASFHQIDEESGSKMDTHNLATVIAPNILYANSKLAMDESFLAIEVVHALIACNDQMCEVPEDLQSILSDSSLFNSTSDITTKEILKRYGDLGQNGGARHQPVEIESTQSIRPQDIKPTFTRVDTDPSQAFARQNEASVRHVQEAPPFGGSSSQHTPPQQQWQGQDHPSPYNTPDGQHDNRREYRNSGWGGRSQNGGSVGITGTG